MLKRLVKHLVQHRDLRSLSDEGISQDDLQLPSPTGYCWEVVSIAANGTRSEPARSIFRYNLLHPPLAFPGVHIGVAENDLEAALAGYIDVAHGSEVTTSWHAAAGTDVAAYSMSVGRWPWRFTTPGTFPQNCGDCSDFLAPRELSFQASFLKEALSVDPTSGAFTRTLGADAGGKGRYCWDIFPHLRSATSPEQEPFVGFGHFCYATRPALPRIELDRGETNFDVSCDKLTGKFVFDYANAGYAAQVTVDGEIAQGEITASPGCNIVVENDPFKWDPSKAWIYPDVYDCSLSFEVKPVEHGKTYRFNATAFSMPGTAHEDQSAEEKTFTTGSCGGANQTCCNCEPKCREQGLVCVDATCQACGGEGEPCCDGECADTLLHCRNGFCSACGSRNLPCCDDHATGDGCSAGVVCDGGVCKDCGDVGELCCEGNECHNGIHVMDCVGGRCHARECGHTNGGCCCAGNRCNSVLDTCVGIQPNGCGGTCKPPDSACGSTPSAVTAVNPGTTDPLQAPVLQYPVTVGWTPVTGAVEYEITFSTYTFPDNDTIKENVVVTTAGTTRVLFEAEVPVNQLGAWLSYSVVAINNCGMRSSPSPKLWVLLASSCFPDACQ